MHHRFAVVTKQTCRVYVDGWGETHKVFKRSRFTLAKGHDTIIDSEIQEILAIILGYMAS